MNKDQIDAAFDERFGENDRYLQQHYDAVQRDFSLTEDERADRGIDGQERATIALFALEEWRGAALAERAEDLEDDLFAVATVRGFDGSVVKEDANGAQLAAINASDAELEVLGSRAARSKNTTLSKAVASEADARDRADIATAALGWLPKKLEAYQELKSIPDAEERAERLERARTSIPLPSMSRLRPTAAMHETQDRIQAVNRAQRPPLAG
jgi:hypothetical protein